MLVVPLLVAPWVLGCAQWRQRGELSETSLPAVRENPKSVILSVQFIPIEMSDGDADKAASIWQWVDETSIDTRARQSLADNGLRVGKAVSLPRLQSRLESLRVTQDVVDDFLEQASIASDAAQGDMRIPIRFGRRYELPLKKPVEGDEVPLIRLNGETIGRTLSNPQYLFALTAEPGKQSGSVRIRFRPEIQHGHARRNWVSSESAVRIDSRRETWPLEQLDLEIIGSEGDAFLIAGGSPLEGLAKNMLGGVSADSTPHQVAVLVTLDQIPNAIDQL